MNTVVFDVEYTDTFGGDANYSWVNRCRIQVPENATDKLIMRRAKAAVGLTGVRGVTSWYGDTGEFRPYRMATVMFVTFDQTQTVEHKPRQHKSYERHGFLIQRDAGPDAPWRAWREDGESFRAQTLALAFHMAKERSK